MELIKSVGLSEPQRGRVFDVLAVATLWLMCFLFLAPAFLPGNVLLPLDIIVEGMPPWQGSEQVVDLHNPILEDAVYYIYPIKEWTAEAVRQGELPLWNPAVFTGYPAIYDTQAGLFYPFSILYYLLPTVTAVNLTILLQMMAGTLFMYLYLRQIQLQRLASAVGSILFVFNGMMIVWLEWQVVHAAVIWLPLVLFFVERAFHSLAEQKRNPFVNAAAAGLVLAVPWLGGHWNWTLYMSMTVGVYLLWRLAAFWPRQRKQAMTIVAVTLGVGIGLSLIQVLPAFHFLSQSHRQPLTWSDVQQYGLFNRLVVLTLPDFFGSPLAGNWWGVDNYNETTFYMGIVTLLLAGMGIWLRRDALTRFWAVWGGLGLLLALGAPFYGALFVLPVFNGLLPSRAAVLVVVSTAVLAAVGVDALARGSFRPSSGWVLVGITSLLLGITAVYLFYYRDQIDLSFLRKSLLVFLMFLIAGCLAIGLRLRARLSANWFAALVLLLIISDLYLFGHNYNKVSAASDLFPPTAIDAFLQNESQPLRMVTQAQGVAYRPNTSLVPRISNLSGYGPGIPQRLVDYMDLAEGGESIRFNRVLMPLAAVDSPLLDALGVGYVVTIEEKWGGTAVSAGARDDIATFSTLSGSPRQSPFFVGEAGLQRMDVALQQVEPADGTVTMRIFTPDGAQELAHSELDATLLNETDWASFYFSVFPAAWGETFLLELDHNGNGELAVGETAVGEVAYASYVLPRPHLLHEDGKTRIYQRENALPLAYAVPTALTAESQEDALALVAENSQRLNRVVVLEDEDHTLPIDSETRKDEAGTVTITHYGRNKVTLETEIAQPGFVVLADLYYPGWQATVDGEPVSIYRANTVSRAIAVPAGQHDIQFVYRPVEFYVGALVSGLVLLVVSVFWGWTAWRRH